MRALIASLALVGASPVAAMTLPTALQLAPPAPLDAEARTQARDVLAAIRSGRLDEAATLIEARPEGVLLPYLKAELALARGAAAADPIALRALIAQAPELPQAPQLAQLARARDGAAAPALPVEQALLRVGASRRAATKPVRADAVAQKIAPGLTALLKNDRPAEAEALLTPQLAMLSAAARSEWQQRIGWAYYVTGDNVNARRLAVEATTGSGDWVVQAQWLAGLAAWRAGDCAAAGPAFDAVATSSNDPELRAAGHFWAARSAEACGTPEVAPARLRAAAAETETFYGLLASARLGAAAPGNDLSASLPGADPTALMQAPNIIRATALATIGETAGADALLRRQARIGNPDAHVGLFRLAGQLGLTETQIWLSQNAPKGITLPVEARYLTPGGWTPQGGWRVEPSLVLAHSLQESQFRPDAVSRSGAIGLMQLIPGTAQLVARRRGLTPASTAELKQPAISLEYGQSYLEMLRDTPSTQGLLPKIVAAYNAGPGAVAAWNTRLDDAGDPLLFIESIPYAETRAYVALVLRNLWMYERREGRAAASLDAMAQGLWPRFPGLPGETAVRLAPRAPGLTNDLAISATD